MINKTKRVFIAEYANHVEPWTKSHDRYYYIIRHNELELSGRLTFPMIVNFVTAQSTLWLKNRLSLSLSLFKYRATIKILTPDIRNDHLTRKPTHLQTIGS